MSSLFEDLKEGLEEAIAYEKDIAAAIEFYNGLTEQPVFLKQRNTGCFYKSVLFIAQDLAAGTTGGSFVYYGVLISFFVDQIISHLINILKFT